MAQDQMAHDLAIESRIASERLTELYAANLKIQHLEAMVVALGGERWLMTTSRDSSTP